MITRKIDNKIWMHHTTTKRKGEARAIAEDIRKKGKNVRVLPSGSESDFKGYSVWIDMAGLGLFQEPKHAKYAEMVSFESTSQAEESAKALMKDFERKKTRKGQNVNIRVANLAANRAAAAIQRENLKPETRERYGEISKIYRNVQVKMSESSKRRKE